MFKFTRYVCLVLMLVSIAIAGYAAFVAGFSDGSIDALLYWTYGLVGFGVLAILALGIGVSAAHNPKSLIKILVGAVVLCGIVAACYFLASGDPVHVVGQSPSASTLKLTDTILNITYFTLGCSVVSIIIGAVINVVRK